MKDRIKDMRRVRAGDLVPNPKNWREHPAQQAQALRAVLDEVGICDALIARELDDGRLMLIDGHLRAETMPDDEVPVLVLDVSESEADKVLATLDPLAGMAQASSETLAELLTGIQTSSPALQSLLDSIGTQHGAGSREATLKEIKVQPPPVMSWVLIGIPTVRFGESAESVQSIGDMPDVICETVVNNG